ncbi:MAG: hypothetical protein AVDCRST_MAG45-955, partial [uncultured Solirubrobacterales bacterium]
GRDLGTSRRFGDLDLRLGARDQGLRRLSGAAGARRRRGGVPGDQAVPEPAPRPVL